MKFLANQHDSVIALRAGFIFKLGEGPESPEGERFKPTENSELSRFTKEVKSGIEGTESAARSVLDRRDLMKTVEAGSAEEVKRVEALADGAEEISVAEKAAGTESARAEVVTELPEALPQILANLEGDTAAQLGASAFESFSA